MRQVISTEKRIFRDPDFILLNINAGLVILGYGLAIYTDSASTAPMKIIKSFFLILSAIGLLRGMKLNRNAIPSPSFIYVLVLAFWVMLMSFFSNNVSYSISRALNFLVPFIYVYIALHNILNKYDVISVLKAFIRTMNIIYFIPIAAYLLSGAGFGQINIYGQTTAAGDIFVSNHYGWASAIYLLTSADILLASKRPLRKKIFLIVFTIIALYIALISGNRACWLSLLFATIIFILRLKTIRTDFKILLMILPITAIIWFSRIPESSINSRLAVTENQIEEGEARFNTAKLAATRFNENKVLWLTGAGMFNYEGIMHGGGLSDYHNSYFEILFGGGVILFLLFINFMVFKPIYNYTRLYSKYFIVFPPLMIIPFFESNLTGGQFLFFPWFIFMLLFNLSPGKEVRPQNIIRQPAYNQ